MNGGEAEEPDVLTVPEAAAFLRLHPKALYKLIDDGTVPYVRVGPRRIRLLRSSLVEWLKSREIVPGRKARR